MPSQTCYARAKHGLAIGRPRFTALVADAIVSRLVAGPWRVHRQRLDRSEVADPQRIDTGDGTAALSGDDPSDLLALLPDLARTGADLCIVFAGFNLGSRKVTTDLKRYNYGDCPLSFISLKTATTVDVDEIIGEDEEPAYGHPLADDEDDDQDDDDDEDEDDDGDDDGDDVGEAAGEDYPDELSLKDGVVFSSSGPDFADLDEKSLLIGFLNRHFGMLMVGEVHR